LIKRLRLARIRTNIYITELFYPALKALRRVKHPRVDVAYVQNGCSAGDEGREKVRSKRKRERRGVHGEVSGAEGGGVHGTPCAALVAARVSHGHGVHCPEPRPQGHRPTEPIVPLLCSSTHFRRVLLLAMRVHFFFPEHVHYARI